MEISLGEFAGGYSGLEGLKRFDCIERLTVEDPIDYTLIFLWKQR